MNDCTQEAMLRCMHVLSISLAVGPIITEKLTKMPKYNKVSEPWNIGQGQRKKKVTRP